jgi:hypothetical protein
MLDIDTTAQTLCDAGAAAMYRYAEISGEDPLIDMPEYFLQSFIMDHLGDEFTITIETSLTKLSKWNDGARKLLSIPPLPSSEKAKLEFLGTEIGLPRVDMALFDRDDLRQRKDDQGFLAFVEFKKGVWAMVSDRHKLMKILPHIDTCPYGIVCGGCSESEIHKFKKMSDDVGDSWFQTPVKEIPDNDARYFFCARLFARSADLSLIDP